MSGSVEHGAQPDTVVQRAYCCQHCGVQCRRPQDLRRHLLVHTDASFSCERCGHKFTRYDTLTRHKRDNCHGASGGQHRSQQQQQQQQQIQSELSDAGEATSPNSYYAANAAIQKQIKATAEMSVETSPTSRAPSQPQIIPPSAPPQHLQHLAQPPGPQPQHQPQQNQPPTTILPPLPQATGIATMPQLSPLQTHQSGLTAGMLSFSPPGHQVHQPVQQSVPQPVHQSVSQSVHQVPSVQVSQVSPVQQVAPQVAPQVQHMPSVSHVSPSQVPPVSIQASQLVPPTHLTSGATAYLPQVVPFSSSQSTKPSSTDQPIIDKGRGPKPEPWRNNQPMEPNPIGLPPLFQPLRMLRHHSDAELEVQRQRFDSKLTLQVGDLEDALQKIHNVVGSLDSRMGNIESRLTHLETHLTPSPQPQPPPTHTGGNAAAPTPPSPPSM